MSGLGVLFVLCSLVIAVAAVGLAYRGRAEAIRLAIMVALMEHGAARRVALFKRTQVVYGREIALATFAAILGLMEQEGLLVSFLDHERGESCQTYALTEQAQNRMRCVAYHHG